MPRLITFKILRYALIPYVQMDQWEQPLPEPKGRAIEVVLPLQDAPPHLFQYRNQDCALVGFTSLAEDNRFHFGRLAKKRQTAIGELREREVVEINTEDWIPIWILFDTVEQYIAVEMNSYFGSLQHVIHVLHAVLTAPVEEKYRNEVTVSPVTDPQAFWQIVARADRIYQASLRFVSPNFLDTPGEFREILSRWKGFFNQTAAIVDLKNDEGELSLPNHLLEEPIEYIAAGEGEWKLIVEERGQKRSMSSKESSESLQLPIPRASHSPDEIEKAEGKERMLVQALLDRIRRRRADP